MKTKILVGIIILLVLILICESVYLLNVKNSQRAYRSGLRHPEGIPMDKFFSDDFSMFDDMHNWDPFQEIEKMQQRMHRMFEDSFARGLKGKSLFRKNYFFEPNISIRDAGSAYVVNVDLPGLDKDTINVEINGRQMTISGERKVQESQQQKGFYRQELSYGNFSRSITLPDDAKVEGITSEYKRGVLTIRIPKEKDAQRAKLPKIKISVE
jgi:HSP20 family protein